MSRSSLNKLSSSWPLLPLIHLLVVQTLQVKMMDGISAPVQASIWMQPLSRGPAITECIRTSRMNFQLSWRSTFRPLISTELEFLVIPWEDMVLLPSRSKIRANTSKFPRLSLEQKLFRHCTTVHFRSVSAFAPISNPSSCPWGVKAFSGMNGTDNCMYCCGA